MAFTPVLSGATRLQPPHDLDPKVAALFREIVGSCPSSQFALSDTYLLAAYCTALHVARHAAPNVHKDKAALGVWERATRALATLAVKLRLCPSARSDPQSLSRATLNHMPSYYDRMRDEQTNSGQ